MTKAYLCIANLTEMLDTILISLLIVTICVALLGVNVFFTKSRRFPNLHVSGNKALRKKGIGCAQSQDREARKANPLAVRERSTPPTEN